ncbi:hypothetical protein I8751_23900 [Nostocaceae cyanobacterium CENA357]|uniref:Lipoprotein n=1 Tax=Atlanticothrix silvestris CENA357 TaxID=1725252 RepID=A0A8J7L3W2_9CYAN|nr:DNA/RNA helicase domain-containing protein [Atlanticothrix silvestris]MBH8555335.1 hypothetical protein [Atlanticothrix silvestris CENA357]
MKKSLKFVVIVFCYQLISGCGQKNTNDISTLIEQKPVNTVEDIKNSFNFKIKEDIETLNKNIKKQPSKDPGLSFVKAEYSGKNLYDIQKSDSIVSPYIGIVKYYLNWKVKEEVITDTYIKATYVFQDDKWIFKNAERLSDNTFLKERGLQKLEDVNYLFQ